MRLLDRYIVKMVCGHVALVMGGLLTLLAVFLYINEQGWVGAGRYGQPAAMWYVLLNLPAAALQFLPVGALIGSLLAMGLLARGSELTVMRASGMSVARICGAVLMAGLLMLPLAAAVGEWLAPPLTQMAREFRAVERSGSIHITQAGNAWVRDGRRIVRVGSGNHAGAGVLILELDSADRLDAVLRAGSAQAARGGGHELLAVEGTRFTVQGTEVITAGSLPFDMRAGTELLDLAMADPRDLSLRELAQVSSWLSSNGQDARRYRFAFWSGVARLVAIPLALLLAVPFVLGTLRNAGSGARATLGLALGLVYYIGQRMVESGAIAFALDPLLLAWLPTALLAAGVGLLLARQR